MSESFLNVPAGSVEPAAIDRVNNLLAILTSVSAEDVDAVDAVIDFHENALSEAKRFRTALISFMKLPDEMSSRRKKPRSHPPKPKPELPEPPAEATADEAGEEDEEVPTPPPTPPPAPTATPAPPDLVERSPQFASKAAERASKIHADRLKIACFLCKSGRAVRTSDIMKTLKLSPRVINELLNSAWFQQTASGVAITPAGRNAAC